MALRANSSPVPHGMGSSCLALITTQSQPKMRPDSCKANDVFDRINFQGLSMRLHCRPAFIITSSLLRSLQPEVVQLSRETRVLEF